MKKSKSCPKLIFLFSTILFLSDCQSRHKLVEKEGYLNVTGGKIWYRITGSGDKTPLLLLHGGPGIPSYYLKPLAALANERPVIFFDQLGCGKSDRLTDTSLMTVSHYVDEVKQVVDQLGLKDYYLFGQSWGTMLGTDFYLQHPKGIKALIFSSPAISIPMWMKDADTLISTLADSTQRAIRINEQNKTFDSPAYQQAIQAYYQQFVARKLPWSPDIDSCFMEMGETVYKYMAGPSEFSVTGALKDFDRTGRLHEITVPTLFITGEFDEARPSTVKYYASLVPGSGFEIIKNAGHLTMQDNPAQSNEVLREFLNNLEKNRSN